MEQDKKRQKYDRQLRLWKNHGQEALETAKICLLYGSATGTELLKNLILPGVGSFMVVDDRMVTELDLENNFFLSPESLGKSRGQQVTEYLRELNEDVSGTHAHRAPADLIQKEPGFFRDFQLVIATEMAPESVLLRLAGICLEFRVPLVVARSYGFLGYVRLVCPELTVIETHPDNAVDLRLDCPWKELHDYATTGLDWDTMDSMQRSHVPFVLLLLKFSHEWKAKHGGQIPRTAAERNEFKAWMMQHAPTPDEENFLEASGAVFRLVQKTSVPSAVQKLFQDLSCVEVNGESSRFWIMVAALEQFVAKHGVLPLPGGVPDMKADTESYVALQHMYRRKAMEDLAEMRQLVDALLAGWNLPPATIEQEYLELFCKNAAHVKVVRHRSLHQEYVQDGICDMDWDGLGWVEQGLNDADNPNTKWYILFRAMQRFHEKHGRHPGEREEDDLDGEVELLRTQVDLLLSDLYKLPVDLISDDYVREMCRYGASELHCIAAMVGGIGAQECLKILTKQYIPAGGTILVNGMLSTTSQFEF